MRRGCRLNDCKIRELPSQMWQTWMFLQFWQMPLSYLDLTFVCKMNYLISLNFIVLCYRIKDQKFHFQSIGVFVWYLRIWVIELLAQERHQNMLGDNVLSLHLLDLKYLYYLLIVINCIRITVWQIIICLNLLRKYFLSRLQWTSL